MRNQLSTIERSALILLWLVVVLTDVSISDGREWTDATGTDHTQADFVDFKDGKVRLKKPDGKIVSVPIELLSAADQAFVKEQAGAATQTEATKLPPPNSDAVRDATKLVQNRFKNDIAKARKPEEKAALARKLLRAGIEERKDATGQFALLNLAKDTAVEGGDFETARKAIDEIGKIFQIDTSKVSVEAAFACARSFRPGEDRSLFVVGLHDMIDEAIQADRLDMARQMGDLALTQARLTNDPELARESLSRVQLVRDAEDTFADTKKALATLSETPADPEANLKVGKYRCFVKGDWDGGLPMLAQGSDPELQALAKMELAAGASADARVALGDGWHEVVAKLSGSQKPVAQARAAKAYKEALPSLTGATRTRVEQRLAAFELAGNAGSSRHAINLLPLVDTTRDTVSGKWVLKDGVLQPDEGECRRLQLPYHPPAEYDFRVDFVWERGGDVNMIATSGPKQFMWLMAGWGNTVMGFETVAWKRANENPTTIKSKAVFEKGKRNEVILKVRKTGVQAWINGELASEWKTDYKDMGLAEYWGLRDKSSLGLATYASATRFLKIEVKEITGKGTVLREDRSPAPAKK